MGGNLNIFKSNYLFTLKKNFIQGFNLDENMHLYLHIAYKNKIKILTKINI